MSESKSVVLNIRLAPTVMEAATERAKELRQPVRRMVALLVEDGLGVSALRSEIADLEERNRILSINWPGEDGPPC